MCEPFHQSVTTNRSSKCIANCALAESIIGLYKTEVIWPRGPWKNIDEVEYATLEWVDGFNNKRLLEPIGNVPPAELETAYYEQLEIQPKAA